MRRKADRPLRSLRWSGGFSLTTVLLVLVLLAGGILLVSVLACTGLRRTGLHCDSLAALYAAESGINEALWRIRHTSVDSLTGARPALDFSTYPTEPPSFSGSLNGDAAYRVWVQQPSETQRRVWAEGRHRNVRRLVRLQVEVQDLSRWPGLYQRRHDDPGKKDDWKHVTWEPEEGPLQVASIPPLTLPESLFDLSLYSPGYTGPWPVTKDVDGDVVRADGPVEIGMGCEIHGNVIATGDIIIGKKAVIHGKVISLEGDIKIEGSNAKDETEKGPDTKEEAEKQAEEDRPVVNGDVLARVGSVTLNDRASVTGLVYAGSNVTLDNHSSVAGLVYACRTLSVRNHAVVDGMVVAEELGVGNHASISLNADRLPPVAVFTPAHYSTSGWREG